MDVLSNDFDSTGSNASLTVTAIDSTGTAGIVTLSGGIVNYDPNGMFETLAVAETATDSFSYEITDGNGRTEIATITITIIGANDAPIVSAIVGAAAFFDGR